MFDEPTKINHLLYKSHLSLTVIRLGGIHRVIHIEGHDHLLAAGSGPGHGHLGPLRLHLPAGEGWQRLLILALCGNLLRQEFPNLCIALN